jgi:transposase
VITVSATKEEQELLWEHKRKAGSELIRTRAHSVLLSTKGYGVQEIEEILNIDENTVRRALSVFEKERMASIFPKYQGNTNASKLTKEQKEEIQKTLAAPPKEGGLPGAFWSVKRLKQYLKAEYGVVYESERSYHHILAISGLSFKLPEGLDKRRNDRLVLERMLVLRGEIEKLKKKRYRIFFADECSLSFETELRRAWLKRGEKTVIKVNREKIKQHYFGAWNMDSKKETLVRLDWQDTENISNALRELRQRHQGEKLAVVWDNARWHRSKELRSLLGKGKEFENIRLLWLPPYAPDENPQEHIWKIGKEIVKNKATETFDELKTIFEKSIQGKIFDYKCC